MSEIQRIRTKKQQEVFAAARHKAHEQAIRTGQYAEMGRKGGAIVFEKKIGIFARTPEKIQQDSVRGGKVAGALAVKNGHLSRAGHKGGKLGGRVQGIRNRNIGWCQHIALLRWQLAHNDCKYCNPQKQLN